MCCVLLTNVSSKVTLSTSMCLLFTMHMLSVEHQNTYVLCVHSYQIVELLVDTWCSSNFVAWKPLASCEWEPILKGVEGFNALHYIKWAQFWLLPFCNSSFYFESFVVFLLPTWWMKDKGFHFLSWVGCKVFIFCACDKHRNGHVSCAFI